MFVVVWLAFAGFAGGQQCVTTAPPPDAVVLFDGQDCSQWVMTGSKEPCKWPVADGAMTSMEGDVMTTAEFADAQIHVEFMTPVHPDAQGHGHGNSGVYVQGSFEIQVLDSFGVEQPGLGDCGAIYGQYRPAVNACLKPGEWQSYDIYFRAPRYSENGKLRSMARISVLHNGIWIHDNVEIDTTPGGVERDVTKPGPLMLQYHGSNVRFRNIWLRPLSE